MKIRYLLFIVPFILLYSCGGPLKVYTTQEKDVDFKSYKTFDFYEIKEEHLKLMEVNRRRLAMGYTDHWPCRSSRKSALLGTDPEHHLWAQLDD